MKNKIALVFLVFGFSMLLSQVDAQVDSLSVKPLIPQDSIPAAYEWTARSPLSAEEQRQREENRAEVEDMKRRFRAFHEGSTDKDTKDSSEEEDGDYLWKSSDRNTEVENKAPSEVDTEAIRLEINRSFQQQKNPNESSSELPFEEPKNDELEWERNAFPESSPKNVDWQLNVGQASNQPKLTLVPGQSIVLDQVQFQPNSVELSQSAKNALNSWVSIFQQYPGMKVEIRSHTHQSVPYTEALELTAQRAREINHYFISLGIPEQQLIFRGYGKLLPLFSTSDDDNQQKNERIEVIILELPNR